MISAGVGRHLSLRAQSAKAVEIQSALANNLKYVPNPSLLNISHTGLLLSRFGVMLALFGLICLIGSMVVNKTALHAIPIGLFIISLFLILLL
jgi:hypothetical protein